MRSGLLDPNLGDSRQLRLRPNIYTRAIRRATTEEHTMRMTRYGAALVAVGMLAGCSTLGTEGVATLTQSLTGACNTAASSLRVALASYKAKKLSEVQARVVDNSAAVIDGFCHPGAPVPADLASAAQAITVAGANIVALNLK